MNYTLVNHYKNKKNIYFKDIKMSTRTYLKYTNHEKIH
jgi:hypothetical protein